MRLPRFRFIRLATAALAGVVVLSTLLGPSLLPADVGGNVARAEVVIEINVFQHALSPYGRWIDSPRYGQVWYPVGMHSGWRPYYDDGHWAYSDDDGWIWVSDLPWGWAPFHYGRWAFDPYYGWIWVPGRVWGPAWVTFRQADDYIGWAPLPPEARWDPRYGYRGGSGITIAIDFWSFVRPEGFTARRFDRYAYDRHQYPTIIRRTTNITNITVINNRIVNNSIRVKDAERFTHQRVERFKITEGDRPQGAVIKGNNVVLYKPAVIEQGQAKARTNKNLRPVLVKEDPAQDNKKRFANTNKENQQNQQQQQLKLKQQQDQQQQLKLKQQQDQQLKLKQQQDQQLKLKQQQQQDQQLKLKQQQQQLKLKQQQQDQQRLNDGADQGNTNKHLKQQHNQQQQNQQQQNQQEQGQPNSKKGQACGEPGQPPCQ